MGLFGNFKRGVKRAYGGAKTKYNQYQEYAERTEKKRDEKRKAAITRYKAATQLERSKATYYKAQAQTKKYQPSLFGGLDIGGGGGGFAGFQEMDLYGNPIRKPRKRKAKKRRSSKSITINY